MWFITVMEKMDSDGWADGFCDNGDLRTWGFYSDRERAVEALHKNLTDMHEYRYEYAVIEGYEEGIGYSTGARQWFKYDESRDGYFEIDEPDCVKNICDFALG